MTRINVVPPEELDVKHLVAEYRELPRVFKLAFNAWREDRMPPSSKSYVLGKGHVQFFYDKLGFLRDRQRALIAEMLRRGYNPTHTSVDFEIPCALLGSWQPDAEALKINRQRLLERLSVRKQTKPATLEHSIVQ